MESSVDLQLPSAVLQSDVNTQAKVRMTNVNSNVTYHSRIGILLLFLLLFLWVDELAHTDKINSIGIFLNDAISKAPLVFASTDNIYTNSNDWFLLRISIAIVKRDTDIGTLSVRNKQNVH